MPTPEEQAAALARVQLAPGWTPLIRSWADLNTWTTDEQRAAFEKWLKELSPNKYNLGNEPGITADWVNQYKTPRGHGHWTYTLIKEALVKGLARIPLDAVLTMAARRWAPYPPGTGQGQKTLEWMQRNVWNRIDLATANLELAGFKIARALQANKNNVIQAAQAFGVRTDISDDDMAGALTFLIADTATTQGLLISQVVEIYGAVQVQGAGSILSEFWNDAKDWFNQVVIKNIGRAFVWVAEQILKGRKNIPWLGTYFLDPLGISLLAEAMRQVGEYMRTQDAATSFNERVLLFELGTHWTALGQALIVAGGMISGSGIGLPLGALITAIGVILYAAGAVILGEARAREARSRARAEEEKLELMELELAKDCKQQMQLAGIPLEQIPKDSKKCINAFTALQDAENPEEKTELLSTDQPAPEAAPKRGLVILGALAAAYLLTRR